MQTDFVVAEGLTLTTRFDALEKKWGDRSYGAGRTVGPGALTAGWNAPAGADSSGRVVTANGIVKEQENIEFERAYLTFKSAIGLWMVGYQQFLSFGTDVGNSSLTRPGIKYILPIGNLALIAAIEKGNESDIGADIGRWSDADQDIYDLGFVYKLGKMGDVGMMYQHVENQTGRPVVGPLAFGGADLGTVMILDLFDPYVRLNLGPVFIEAEALYLTGELTFDDSAAQRHFPRLREGR